MASAFAGLSLFNSGPHRFVFGPVGRLVRPPFATALELPYSVDEGPRELAVLQTGRLVASSTSLLWALADAIQAQAELPRTGTLVDHHGRSWSNLTLWRFQPLTPVDRGRTVSLAYTVRYLRFAG